MARALTLEKVQDNGGGEAEPAEPEEGADGLSLVATLAGVVAAVGNRIGVDVVLWWRRIVVSH